MFQKRAVHCGFDFLQLLVHLCFKIHKASSSVWFHLSLSTTVGSVNYLSSLNKGETGWQGPQGYGLKRGIPGSVSRLRSDIQTAITFYIVVIKTEGFTSEKLLLLQNVLKNRWSDRTWEALGVSMRWLSPLHWIPFCAFNPWWEHSPMNNVWQT